MASSIPWLLCAALSSPPTTTPSNAVAALELRWHAPAQCPDQAALEQAIAALAIDAPIYLTSRPRIDARVEAQTDGFALELRIDVDGRTRSRSLVAKQCASLVDAVAIEAAMLLEAGAVTPEVPPRPHGTVTLVGGTVRVRAPARPQLRLRGTATLGGAVIEGASAGFGGGFVVAGTHWAASLEAVHWPRGFAPLPARTSAGASLHHTDVIASGCGRLAHGRVGATLCGGFAIGARVASGRGLAQGRDAVAPTLALVLAPAIEWQTPSPIVVALAPWVRAAIVRPGVRVDGIGEIARPRTWAFGGALRLEFTLWPPADHRPRRRGRRLRDGSGAVATLMPRTTRP